jgi:hypothetical protein
MINQASCIINIIELANKEMLLIMDEFFYYLYVRYFILIIDYKLLTQIVHLEKLLPVLVLIELLTIQIWHYSTMM